MGHYIGVIGFPCVLFSALATLDSDALTGFAVPLTFAILASKAIVFGLAYALGALTSSSPQSDGGGMKRGALFAIYGTQSDDVGLGVPVLGVLFPGHTCPLYLFSALRESTRLLA